MLTKKRKIYKPIQEFMNEYELKDIKPKTLSIKFLIPYNLLKDLKDIQRINFVKKYLLNPCYTF